LLRSFAHSASLHFCTKVLHKKPQVTWALEAMKDIPKIVETATLPQYQGSAAFMERFIDAAHYYEGGEISRTPDKKGIKLVDGSEIDADVLSYFIDNKAALEKEFLQDLINEIGKVKAELFCNVISSDWYDGKGLRNGARVSGIKLGIKQYLTHVISNTIDLSDLIQNHEIAKHTQLFSGCEIEKILTINFQMMMEHIEAWKAQHPNSDWLSTDDIFLRRGLSLDNEIDTEKPYREWDYINSYSIAFSAPEMFAQMQKDKLSALINGDIGLFGERILFFSPFIPNMKVGQIEAGIIPSSKSVPIKYQGKHGDIYEYILDARP
jgi:hypothetical protein